MGVVEELREARASYERRDWVAAYRALSHLDDDALDASDFLALATTAYLLGRTNDEVQALQRAHQMSLDAGDKPGAVRAAYWLASTLWQRGEVAVGNGWLARAVRIMDEVEGDVAEHGYVSEALMMSHIFQGELAEALVLAPQVADYGRRFADPELLALGLHAHGRLLVSTGRVADGLGLLDEALAGVMAGEVGPVTAGRVYCSTIEACQEVSDLGRAGSWTRALTRWCESQPGLLAYTGQCATHRGQLLRLHGAFGDAVEELEQAIERYCLLGGHPAVGLAFYELGETRRLQGELDAAEEAYDEAGRHGHPGQPGRALLWLAQGRTDAAVGAIRGMLTERQGPVQRAQVLPAAVQVLVAADEAAEAVDLSRELHDLAETFGCSALQASGRYAAALAAVTAGEPARAADEARRAVEGWSTLDAPYETARSRAVLGLALRLLGDEQSAVIELERACASLTELGAATDRREVAALVSGDERPGGLTTREIEVLRLVATGLGNTQIAERLTLSEKTVARHLSNIFTKLDVSSRTAAAAYAFEQRLV